MIDFHCHILPGLDDGPIDVSESVIMASRLVDFGFRVVCCTPHCIKGYYDLTAQKVREATLMLQADLDNADIRLELWPGMEYMLDESFVEQSEELLPLGPTNLLLCEAPPQTHAECVREGLKLITEKGLVPLIAHPERTPYFYELLTGGTEIDKAGFNSERVHGSEHGLRSEPFGFIKKLFSSRAGESTGSRAHNPKQPVLESCHYLANLGSFTGFYGPQVQGRSYQFLKSDLYSGLASDLHDAMSAGQVLQQDKLVLNPYLKKLAEWDGSVAPDAFEKPGKEEQIGLF